MFCCCYCYFHVFDTKSFLSPHGYHIHRVPTIKATENTIFFKGLKSREEIIVIVYVNCVYISKVNCLDR